MTAIMGNIVGVLFVIAALGILAAFVYGAVSKAYAETVLAAADDTANQKPKYHRYGNFLWRLVYPVLAVAGICLKIMLKLMGNASKPQEETRWHNGTLWHHNSSIGGWYSYGADEDDSGPITY